MLVAVALTSSRSPPFFWQPRAEVVALLPAYEPRPLTRITSMYRGDVGHNGVSDVPVPRDLVAQVLTDKGNVGIHGAAKATPAVDASGIYVPTDDGYLYAFAHDGRPLWQMKVSNAPSGIHGTPMLDEERIYFGAYNGRFYALRKSDGQPLWVTTLGDAIGSSPTPDGDDVIVAVETRTPNGYVARLARSDGHVVWTSQWLGEQSHATATIVDDAIYLGSNRAEFLALDKHNGHLLWRTNVRGDVKGTACVVNDVVIGVTNKGAVFGLAIADGKLVWQDPLGVEGRASTACLAAEGLAYVSVSATPGSGTFGIGSFGVAYALEAATGTVRWSALMGGPRPTMSALLAPDAASGRMLAWLRCDDTAICAYDAVSGLRLTSIELGAPLTGTVVVSDGGLVLSLDHPGSIVRLVPPGTPALARTGNRDAVRKPFWLLGVLGVIGGVVFLSWEGTLRVNTPSQLMFPVRGIDVSHHQGSIDWQRVRAAGVAFAYIKASEGADFVDPEFAANWRGARAAGVPRGAYHFFTLCTPVKPQIDNFVATVYEVGELPPAIDLELGGNCANPPATADVQLLLNELVPTVVKRLGEPAIFYTTYEFREAYLCPTCVHGTMPLLWIRDVFWRPALPANEPWVFWQHHNRGHVDGITGPVDLDVFHGDTAAFERYKRDRHLDMYRGH